MADDTTPADGGKTPTSGTLQTSTPAIDGQTPVSQATTDDGYLVKLRKENADIRKRLEAFEKAQADADAAKLSETERLQKEHADLQADNEDLAAALMEANVNQDIARLASKFNFVIAFDLVSKLIEWSEIEWDEETGRPTNIEKLLEKLAKASPDLVKAQATTPGLAGQRQAPTTPAMNPGRSSVSPPGGNIPGRIPRLEDIEWKR